MIGNTFNRGWAFKLPWKSEIIEFHELPEREKYNFDYYEKNKHFLLYCKKCDSYKIMGKT